MRTVCRYEVPTVHAPCPVNPDTVDTYTMTVESDHMIEVEKLLQVIDECTAEPVYQESLTQLVALELRAEVRTVGEHSGIRTICTVYPKDAE